MRAALFSIAASALFLCHDYSLGETAPPYAWDISVYDRLLASVQPGQKMVKFGDVGVTPEQLRILRERLVRLQQAELNGVAPEVITDPAGTIKKWTSGNVYYRFDPTQTGGGSPLINAFKMQAVRDAVGEWAASANLTFVEFSGAPPNPNYITYQQNTGPGEGGFSSSVGMAGGEQFIQIGANSWNRGTLCHETGHALGLWHEQQRPDRGTYVTINSDNIDGDPGPPPTGQEGNFSIVVGGQTLGTTYDFYSVMQYARAALTNKSGTPNPNAPDPTIDTIDPTAPYVQFLNIMGNVYERILSKQDRAGMAGIYGNPAVAPSATVTNTKDSGSGSLRAALYYAFDRSTDAVPTPTTVTFHIPTSDPNYNASTGVFTIRPTYLLVAPGAGTTIDGTTQTSFTGDTNTSGPEILLDGSQIAAQNLNLFASGIYLHDPNCRIKNLIINGFNQNGIVLEGTRAALFGTTANGNIITGCYIGTDRTGTVGVANTFPGIELLGGASNNTIGGLTSATRNVISGNASYGISMHDSGTNNNLVEGNYIGTNAAATGAVSNAAAGIGIFNGSSNNTIGGTTSTARNIISGNKQQGIQILDSGTNGNVIQGNYIGVNVSGTAAIANGFFDPPNESFSAGIDIFNGAQNNVIGGTVLGSGNVISGNAAYGVGISNSGTNGNIVRGNLIGTNTTGSAAIPNGNADPGHLPFPVLFAGVGIFGGASNNIIGSAGSGNLISGNAAQGVIVSNSGSNGNVISGNIIGLNAAQNAALPNAFSGVGIFGGAQNNTIGGLTSNAGNIISGNSNQGIAISNSGTNGNVVQGNYIGVNSGGGTAFPNAFEGVAIFGSASNNTIGGLTSSARNVISGNSGAGVSIGNSGTNGNLVQGNYIGTDASGATAVGNTPEGVSIYGGAQNNVIGGGAGARNVISGNGARGVGMFDAATMNNTVQGNYIGLNAAGTAAIANNFSGVEIYLGSNNTIGGTTGSTRNFISGNNDRGVLIDGANASGNMVQGNTIGLDVTGTARANANTCVEFFTGSHANTIGGTAMGASNQIAGNTNDGIRVYDSGTDGTNMMALLGNS
ncbi:MAG: M12 family metallopeptidase, partial [Limisphaerales bacterium]